MGDGLGDESDACGAIQTRHVIDGAFQSHQKKSPDSLSI
jgi:hypothetical protein